MFRNSYSLPKGIQLGRKEVNEVAERRRHDVKTFLDALFNLQESVAHSDLVYTFFHPILRDQEEANIRQKKLKGTYSIQSLDILRFYKYLPLILVVKFQLYILKFLEGKSQIKKASAGQIKGELKLSLEYRKDALLVMVHHAKDLTMPDGSKEAPNSYVKVHILNIDKFDGFNEIIFHRYIAIITFTNKS